jgi:hypothetical protein
MNAEALHENIRETAKNAIRRKRMEIYLEYMAA